MKTFSKILLGMVLAIAMTCFLIPNVNAQNCQCDPDVPRMGTIPWYCCPTPGMEGRYIYQTTHDTIFRNLHCGANPTDPVDPCNPWVLEFRVKLWEEDIDCVVMDSIVWNWGTDTCQLVEYEFEYPVGYTVGSISEDSIIVKIKMTPHESTKPDALGRLCRETAPPYECLNNLHNVVYPTCWYDCLLERMCFWGHDVCPIPNIVCCRIEWDKPLPVELTSFTTTVSGNNAILNWTTAKEVNNSGFAVERYADGIWTEAGFVNGNGNSTLPVDYTYTDRNLNSGLYGYRLRQVDFNGNNEYLNLNGMVTIGTPETFALSQNYPNPFNPTTTIVYGVPANGPVTLKIFDNLGREVRTLVNEPKTAGYYTVTFSAPELSSGVYFYKLESGNFVSVKRMILMK